MLANIINLTDTIQKLYILQSVDTADVVSVTYDGDVYPVVSRGGKNTHWLTIEATIAPRQIDITLNG